MKKTIYFLVIVVLALIGCETTSSSNIDQFSATGVISATDIEKCVTDSKKMLNKSKEVLFAPIPLSSKNFMKKVLVLSKNDTGIVNGVYADYKSASLFLTHLSKYESSVIGQPINEYVDTDSIKSIFKELYNENDILISLDPENNYHMLWSYDESDWKLKAFNMPPEKLKFN